METMKCFQGPMNQFKDVNRSYWVSFNQNMEEISLKYYRNMETIVQ